MKYILYIILATQADGVAINSQVFDSEGACIAARTVLIEEIRRQQVFVTREVLKCVPQSESESQ